MVRSVAWTLVCALSAAMHAQDRRIVREPVVPSSCTMVKALLMSSKGTIAAADEERLDTARLQAALDGCVAGKAVELAADGAKEAFLTGPITIPAGVTLRIDQGATLFASRDPRLYDVHPGSCGLVNDQPPGCRPVIAVNKAPHAGIMGEGTMDGRGGERLLQGNVTWWELAEQARAGGRQQVPRLIEVDQSDDFTVYNLTLKNSANFHLTYKRGDGFTVWGLKVDTPKKARNTDAIDPGPATDITVTHSFIRTGDDNIAIKGSGGGVAYMTVKDNHFYYGHGMSIGSETDGGVSHVLVENLTLDGPDSGIRIKSNVSRGGLVDGITYRDVCIRNSRAPIFLDTHYNYAGAATNLFPVFRGLLLQRVEISGGGKLQFEGLDASHRIEARLDGVLVDDPARYAITGAHARLQYGPGAVNFAVHGEDVESGAPTPGKTMLGCSERFVPFPVR